MGSVRPSDEGPDAIPPTLIERLNMLLPIPYWATAFLVAALVGPAGFFLADLLSTLDLSKAADVFLRASAGSYTVPQLIGNNLVYPAIVFYCALMIRYMRRRIVDAEVDLSRSSPEWRELIRNSFGSISKTGPALGLTALILLFAFPLVESQVASNEGLAKLYFAVSYPIFFFGAGTFVWMYARSLWGLYKIGVKPLRMESHTRDPLLGLGSFGSISLSLTLEFFVAVFLGVYMFAAYSSDEPFSTLILLPAFLVILGICMFFLPLLNIHGRMAHEKERLRNENIGALVRLADNQKAPADDMKKILVLEHERKQIQEIPTWPLDTPIVRTLVVIILGMIVSTGARFVFVIFGL